MFSPKGMHPCHLKKRAEILKNILCRYVGLGSLWWWRAQTPGSSPEIWSSLATFVVLRRARVSP